LSVFVTCIKPDRNIQNHGKRHWPAKPRLARAQTLPRLIVRSAYWDEPFPGFGRLAPATM